MSLLIARITHFLCSSCRARRERRIAHSVAAVLIASVTLAMIPRSSVHAQTTTEASLATPTTAVVRFRGETLFQVNAPLGALQPQERAKAIEQRLAKIAERSADALATVQIAERYDSSDLLVGEQLVLSITDNDAAPLGRTRQQLAADYEVRLSRALKTEFRGRSLRGISTAVIFAVVATLALAVFVRLLGGLVVRALTKVKSWRGTHLRPVRIRGIELLSASQLTLFTLKAVAAMRWVLVALAGVIYLETVLARFPWTRAAAIQFRSFVLESMSSIFFSILTYLPNLVSIALIVIVVRMILRVCTLFFNALGSGSLRLGGFHAEWAESSAKLMRFAVLALSAVVIFPYLPGAESPAFRSVSIFFGVLLSFGSTAAVANVVAGIVMTYMRPFRLGDRVQIGDTIGDIIDTNLLVVRVRTIKNVEITIPNAAVLGGHILNYSARAREDGLILHTTVTIGYDVPWRQVHELLISAALATDGILETPKPFVLQTSLDDFYVSYQVNAFTDQASRMASLYSELHQCIQDGFASAGVEIMSPHYRAMRDGSVVTLPNDQLPASYVAPTFRVTSIPSEA